MRSAWDVAWRGRGCVSCAQSQDRVFGPRTNSVPRPAVGPRITAAPGPRPPPHDRFGPRITGWSQDDFGPRPTRLVLRTKLVPGPRNGHRTIELGCNGRARPCLISLHLTYNAAACHPAGRRSARTYSTRDSQDFVTCVWQRKLCPERTDERRPSSHEANACHASETSAQTMHSGLRKCTEHTEVPHRRQW